MYLTFFGFREKPFNLTPDPKFLYLNASYREALASLRYGINERKGFVSLIGEAGTGKTTLLRRLLAELGSDVRSVLILNPAVGFDELLGFILSDLGHAAEPGTPKLQLLQALNAELLDTLARGGNVVVLIDEAQDLSIPVLEELRLLSNLETAKEKILQFVLAGQPELDEMLARPELRQLRQRIAVPARLRPLARGEVAAYVAARIAAAGGDARGLFTASALRQLYGFSHGVPRLVNVACDSALVTAYAAGTRLVDRKIMREAIKDLRRGPYQRVVWRTRVAVVALAVVVGAVMGVAASRLAGGSFERGRSAAAPTPERQPIVAMASPSTPQEVRAAAPTASPAGELIADAGRPPGAATALPTAAETPAGAAPAIPTIAQARAAAPAVAMAAGTPIIERTAPPTPIATIAAAPTVESAGHLAAPIAPRPTPRPPRRTPRPPRRTVRPARPRPTEVDDATDDTAALDRGAVGDDQHVRIRAGDTLSGIARRTYGYVSPEILDALERANPEIIADRNLLTPGKTLVLPPDPSVADESPPADAPVPAAPVEVPAAPAPAATTTDSGRETP